MSRQRTDSVFVAGPCDLACLFCDRQRRGTPLDLAASELFARPLGATELTIAGCEPGALPDFPALVARARQGGASRIAVESNGTHELDFAALGVDEVVLTLPATNAHVSDTLLGRPGAHARWCRAVESIRGQRVEVRARLPLASLIQAEPRARLEDLVARLEGGAARLIAVEPYVPRSLPRAPGSERHLPPRLADLRTALGDLGDFALERGLGVRILPHTGLPFCALPERHRSSELFPFDASRPVVRDADDALGNACDRCSMRGVCTGLRRSHLERLGDADLEPLGSPLAPTRRALPIVAAHASSAKLAPRNTRFRVVLANLCEATSG